MALRHDLWPFSPPQRGEGARRADEGPLTPGATALLLLLLAACAHTPAAVVENKPGCAAAISQNGRIVEQKAWGMASLEHSVPNTPDTIFETGSVAKQFTAATLVALEQQGKLSLEDSVRKYIPELPEIANPITLRHMLNHTSGLRDWGVVAEIGGWPRGTRLHTMRQVVDIVARQKSLNYPPGALYSYNNSGYTLAAVVAERVSGKAFPQLTRELFFEPLGMTSSSWRDDFTRVVPRRAYAYTGGRIDMHPENVYGHCCLNTTVGDLLKWNDYLSRETALAAAMERQGILTSGETIPYALGLVVGDYRGAREVAHTGSTGGYRGFLARYPETNLSVALLCNDGNVNPGVTGRNLIGKFEDLVSDTKSSIEPGIYVDDTNGAILNIFEKDGKLRVGFGSSGPEVGPDLVRRMARYRRVEPFVPRDLSEFEGTYVSEEAEVTYVIRKGEKGLTVALPSKEPLTLLPTIHDAFRVGSGTLVHFTRDARGRVDGFDVKASFDMAAGVARVERLHFIRRPNA